MYSSIFCKIKGLIELYSIGPFSCSKLSFLLLLFPNRILHELLRRILNRVLHELLSPVTHRLPYCLSHSNWIVFP